MSSAQPPENPAVQQLTELLKQAAAICNQHDISFGQLACLMAEHGERLNLAVEYATLRGVLGSYTSGAAEAGIIVPADLTIIGNYAYPDVAGFALAQAVYAAMDDHFDAELGRKGLANLDVDITFYESVLKRSYHKLQGWAYAMVNGPEGRFRRLHGHPDRLEFIVIALQEGLREVQQIRDRYGQENYAADLAIINAPLDDLVAALEVQVAKAEDPLRDHD